MKTLTAILLLTILSFTTIAQAQTKVCGYNEPAIQVSTDDNEFTLSWSTAREVNSRYFIVEIATDSIHFTTVETLSAAGNSLFGKTYRFSGDAGTYYRVTLVDMNGARFTSSIVKTPSSTIPLATK